MSNPPVTPPTPPTIGQAAEQVASDVVSDIQGAESAIQTGIAPLAQQARAEYDALSPEAQAAIHKALNDIETLYSVSLAAAHTLYGAKK